MLPIDPADLIFQPGGYNADPGAGSVDFGDLFAVPGSCCGPAGPGSAVNIWWEAPRNMTIQVQLDTYSVGTQGASIDFGIRGGPGGGPLLDLNLQGGSGPASGNYGAPTPAHTTGPGGARGFNTMIIPEFNILANQHVMLRIFPGQTPIGNTNGIGISSFLVQEVPEPTTGLLCSLGGCLLMLRRNRR